jgi:hypothetical protein
MLSLLMQVTVLEDRTRVCVLGAVTYCSMSIQNFVTLRIAIPYLLM